MDTPVVERSFKYVEVPIPKLDDPEHDCAICHSKVDWLNAITTECQHTYCGGCLLRYFTSICANQGLCAAWACPLCRTNTRICVALCEDADIQGIPPPNGRARHLLGVLDTYGNWHIVLVVLGDVGNPTAFVPPELRDQSSEYQTFRKCLCMWHNATEGYYVRYECPDDPSKSCDGRPRNNDDFRIDARWVQVDGANRWERHDRFW